MDPADPTGNTLDRGQAEAIAQALLAEGQARQRERLLRRWRRAQLRRARLRAGLFALLASALCWQLAQAMEVAMPAWALVAAWALSYLLGRRWFAAARPARAVIES